jgi:hypothetical protein
MAQIPLEQAERKREAEEARIRAERAVEEQQIEKERSVKEADIAGARTGQAPLLDSLMKEIGLDGASLEGLTAAAGPDADSDPEPGESA